jgi:hypothetical protein
MRFECRAGFRACHALFRCGRGSGVTGNAASIWQGHPVRKPALPTAVQFNCLLKIWDNDPSHQAYVPLTDANGVTVTIVDSVTQHTDYFTTTPTGTTTSGRISGSVTCVAERDYVVTFFIFGQTFGERTYTTNPSVTVTAKYVSSVLTLLPNQMIVPEYIYPDYAATIPSQFPNIGYFAKKEPRIIEFEETYDSNNFNILVEGDSWFDSFSSALDVFGCVQKLLEAQNTKPNKPVRFLQLQHFGQTAKSMLKENGKNSQIRYMLEYLSKYRFDLILLSCGGNDFALSFGTFLRTGLNPQTTLTAAQSIKAANNLPIDLTYAPTKLKFGLNGWEAVIDRAAVSIYVNSIVGNAFNNTSFSTFVSAGPYEDLANLIYEEFYVSQKFSEIRSWLINLKFALHSRNLSVPILSHSYSYPSFLDTGVFPLSQWYSGDGPFIHPAFEAAGVVNPVLQALCIKLLIDAYKKHVLDAVVANTPGRFRYADVRSLVLSSVDWADEMHLSLGGSAKVAAELYLRIKQLLPGMFQ